MQKLKKYKNFKRQKTRSAASYTVITKLAQKNYKTVGEEFGLAQ